MTENSKVFDFGIGTGKSISKIVESNKNVEIHGVDASNEMLNFCKRAYPTVITSKISDISELRKISGIYDFVISSGAIEFVDQIEELISCFYDIVRINGILSITYEPIIAFHPVQSEKKSLTIPTQESTYHIDDFYTYRHNPSEFNSLLVKSGFKILKDTEFIAYEKSDSKIIYHLVMAKK